jgi:hypothetical protein
MSVSCCYFAHSFQSILSQERILYSNGEEPSVISTASSTESHGVADNGFSIIAPASPSLLARYGLVPSSVDVPTFELIAPYSNYPVLQVNANADRTRRAADG